MPMIERMSESNPWVKTADERTEPLPYVAKQAFAAPADKYCRARLLCLRNQVLSLDNYIKAVIDASHVLHAAVTVAIPSLPPRLSRSTACSSQ